MSNLQKRPKLIEKHKKNTISGRFFEVYSILAEKQRLKPKNLNSLKFSASFDTHLDPRGAILVEILQFLHFVLKFDNIKFYLNQFWRGVVCKSKTFSVFQIAGLYFWNHWKFRDVMYLILKV